MRPDQRCWERRRCSTKSLCGAAASLFCLLLFGTAIAADDDAYLDSLEQEVDKVESRSIDGDTGSREVAPSEVPAGDDVVVGGDRDAFEDDLRTGYAGTFVFYKKLPERSRQEVYDEYRRGASMAEIRQKIIDRMLQR